MDRNPNPFMHICIHYQGTVVYKQIRTRKVFQAPSQFHSKKCGLEGRFCTFCIFLFRKEGFPSFFFTFPSLFLLPLLLPFPLSVIFLVSSHVFQVSPLRKLIFQFPWTKDWAWSAGSGCHGCSYPLARTECSFQKPKGGAVVKGKSDTLEELPTQASHTHPHQHIHAETARRGCRSQRLCFQNINIAPAFFPVRYKNPDYSRCITAKLCKIAQVLSVCLTPFNC